MRIALFTYLLLFALPSEARSPTAEELLQAFPRLQVLKNLTIEPDYASTGHLVASQIFKSAAVKRIYNMTSDGKVKLVRTEVSKNEGDRRRYHCKTTRRITRDTWWKISSGALKGAWVGERVTQERGPGGYSQPKAWGYLLEHQGSTQLYDITEHALQRLGRGIQPEDRFRFPKHRPHWVQAAQNMARRHSKSSRRARR
ncbi:MAG: hypothetical protein JRH20_07365 [Deltaproteobacteria bacterium]|nr:hypothetical protein [Deltaproteobacteria bacterium]